MEHSWRGLKKKELKRLIDQCGKVFGKRMAEIIKVCINCNYVVNPEHIKEELANCDKVIVFRVMSQWMI